MNSQRAIVILTLSVIATVASAAKADVVYTQTFGIADPIVTTPFYFSNAHIYEDPFAPFVRYWGADTPNVEGIVTLKLDIPFTVQTASLSAIVTAYTAGSDANFDPNASTYLDVSSDNINWTTVASQTNQNAVFSGIAGPWDITAAVAGSDTVYVRARLFNTVSYFFSSAQFMRQGQPYPNLGYISATAVPEARAWWFVGIACFVTATGRLIRVRRGGGTT